MTNISRRVWVCACTRVWVDECMRGWVGGWVGVCVCVRASVRVCARLVSSGYTLCGSLQTMIHTLT